MMPVKRKPVPTFMEVGIEMSKLYRLAEEISVFKQETDKKVQKEMDEIGSLSEETRKALVEVKSVSEKLETDFEQLSNEIVTILHEIKKNAPQGEKGEPGKDAQLPDIEELANLAASKVKPTPASLKIIKESVEMKDEEIVPKLNKASNLGDLELSVKNIKDWPKQWENIKAEISRNKQYLHGGGDTVAAGTNVTITRNANGDKVINASGGNSSYKGYWNPTTNTPTLADATGTDGDFYYTDPAGSPATIDLGSGAIYVYGGNFIIYDGDNARWVLVSGGNWDSSNGKLTITDISVAGGLFQTDSAQSHNILNGLIYPTADGTIGQAIKTDGAGNLSIGDVVTEVTSNDGSVTVTNPTTNPDLAVVQSPKLTTGRTIAITGDLTYTSPSFDGSANVTAAGTLATVNSNVGTFGSATQVPQVTVNGKGLVTAASNVTVTPAIGSITGLGTGVATALGINVGTAGSPVVNGGALGTPSSGVATNLTGTAAGLTAGGNLAFKTYSVSGQSDVVADSTADTLTLAAGSNITITTDAATDTITFAASGGGGGVTAWLVKTSNYTAATGDKVLCDSSGGTFTITLPASPSTGDYVTIKSGASAATNNITVARNGSTIMSLAENMTVSTPNAEFTLAYSGSTWSI